MKAYKKYTSCFAIFLLFVLFLMPGGYTEAAKLSKKKVTVYEGKTATLNLKNNKKKAKWTVSGKSVISVAQVNNNEVKITGKKPGNAKIIVKAGKKKYTCKVTVKKAVKLNKTSLTLIKGQVFDLKLTGTSRKAKWTAVNAEVADIRKKSKYVYQIYAKKTGAATIKVKVKGRTYKCSIKVVEKKAPQSGEITENTLKFQEAVAKNIEAYWKRGTHIQYNHIKRMKKSDYFKPEDATASNVIDTDCSGFARALYMETFGIKLPRQTEDLESYIRKYMDSSYVIDALEQDDYTALVEKDQLISRMLSHMEVGDLLVTRFTKSNPKGHVMIGYKWIYDEQGNKTDMWLVHSTGKNDRTECANSRYVSGFKEGTVRIITLSRLIGRSYSQILKDGKSKVFFYGILRPLAVPGIWVEPNGKVSSYGITKSTLERFVEN